MPSGFDSPVCLFYATIRHIIALPLAVLILSITACGDGSSSNAPSAAVQAPSAAVQEVPGNVSPEASFNLKASNTPEASITSEASFTASSFFDDGDGIAQGIDNCPFVRNRDQADADSDGRGDRCECGDANGDGLVDTIDAQLTQRCAVGEFAPNACPFSLCDVTGDGLCNTIDARAIQRVAVGEIAKSDLSCYQLAAPTAALQAADSDFDGLTDAVEIVGWTIQVDELGLGTNVTPSLLTVIDVQSANLGGDTDGDGLDDMTEFLVRSHPGKFDTDGDGLGDAEEWNQWLTSPVSVDSDGDARGPNHDLPPNPALFDGLELDPSVSFRTSPTLDDTDGDGKTDFEEIDDPSRSPLIAELPRRTP